MLSKIFSKISAAFTKCGRRLKVLFTLLGVWGIIFSVVTIAGFKVGFDYDDTLSFTAPACKKAMQTRAVVNSPDYWRALNRAWDLEKTKIIPYMTACFFKITGFEVSVITSRSSIGAEALVKAWKPLITEFHFVQDNSRKSEILSEDGYLFYFGDSDSDITQAREAGVIPVRIKRSRKSLNKDDYNPGALGEWTIPLSEF